MVNINIFAGNENIMRVYEICKCGGFKMKLVNAEAGEDFELDAHQLTLLKGFLGAAITEDYFESQILQEVVRPSFDQVVNRRKQETLADIELRVDNYLLNAQDIDSQLCDSSLTLLKNAYVRLALQPYEIEIILSLAEVIASMDGAKKIRVEHVAEAIQYRSIDKKHKK